MGILPLFRKIVSPQEKNYDNFSSCSTRYLTCSQRSLARYRVEHSKRNFVSPRVYVSYSVSLVKMFVLVLCVGAPRLFEAN